MNLNLDEYKNMDKHDIDQITDKDLMFDEWEEDIDNLKTEIKIQEILVEFFQGEMFRLIRLCAENGINPNKRD